MSTRIQLDLFGVPSTITKRPTKPRNTHAAINRHHRRLNPLSNGNPTSPR
jgi:hypothetical protein